MKISVASVPYFWSKEKYFEFYRLLAKSKASIIYIGETVCSKRRTMKFEDWLEIADIIRNSGKQAVLSTLTLLEAESELKYLRKVFEQKEYLVEANDIAAIQLALNNGVGFVAGTAINLYNTKALNRLVKQGMKRWVVPVELGKQDLAPLIADAQSKGIEVEYHIFGRMPLAHSARCFTARHLGLPKDNCQFKCLDYEQGIKIKTQEGEGFAQINGIQIQSSKVSYLLDRIGEFKQSNIDILRIVPVSADDTLNIVEHSARAIEDKFDVEAFKSALINQYEFCNGFWLNAEGMKYISHR